MKKDKSNNHHTKKKCSQHLHSDNSTFSVSENNCLSNLFDAQSKYYSSDIYNSPFNSDFKSNKIKICDGLNKVEHILIDIYNHHMSVHINQPLNISKFRKEVYELSHGFDDDYYLELMYILLKKIKEIVGRYKVQILKINDIETLRDLIYRLPNKKPKTPNHSPPKAIRKKYHIQTNIKRKYSFINTSEQKNRGFVKKTKRTIFRELRDIKRCLIRSSKDIEEIFISPKKTFNRFSIEQCQREEFLNTLVNDHYIQYLIQTNIDNDFNLVISEIEEDKDNNLTQMSDFLFFLNQDDTDTVDIDPLSLDGFTTSLPISKQSDDVDQNLDLDELVKFIDGSKGDKKKTKKKRKKNAKKPNEMAPDSNNNKEEEEIKDVHIENYKSVIEKVSKKCFEIQKIKTNISEEWLNNVKKQHMNNKKSFNNE